jgi:hypothetical protein
LQPACRIRLFDEQIADSNPALKAQVHALWERSWEMWDEDEILKTVSAFRAKCLWDGSCILGPGPNAGNHAFNAMFYVQCFFPKDQLFGTMGAAMFSQTGPHAHARSSVCTRTLERLHTTRTLVRAPAHPPTHPRSIPPCHA